MKHWNRKKGNIIKWGLLGIGLLLMVIFNQTMVESENVSMAEQIFQYIKGNLYVETIKTHIPIVTAEKKSGTITLWDCVKEGILEVFPLQEYVDSIQKYDTQVESVLSYEMLMAREGIDEQYRNGELVAKEEIVGEEKKEEKVEKKQRVSTENIVSDQEKSETKSTLSQIEPVVQISRQKLQDFDYLIQNFYTVDMTTTINSSQLNVKELLEKDLRLKTTADKPQILIHHTHSQERYADSTEDVSTSIVGVGEYLAKLLKEQYGYNVIHDTGEYDLIDHDNAYAYAGPAVEKILAENPSIEVVIDMHRDGIGEGKLVAEVNGKQTAKIMFFNGLSRTTSNGDLDYLYNPYLSDNLAFSLQMKLAAEEYYPGFTRPNYLKGYRYNLHYCPKSMLVEIGAQTNTVQEAMNAMEPLADLLHKVLQ